MTLTNNLLRGLRNPKDRFAILGIGLFIVQLPIFIDVMNKIPFKYTETEPYILVSIICVAMFCIWRSISLPYENAQRSRT